MANNIISDPMLDMYIFETSQLIEQLEQIIIDCEKLEKFSEEHINEIFRITHTIKGSSAMMRFENISTLAHAMEDLFYLLREDGRENIDCLKLSDIVLKGIDFIKNEVEKIINGNGLEGDASNLILDIKCLLNKLTENNQSLQAGEVIINEPSTQTINQQKFNEVMPSNLMENTFAATLFFEEGCELEDIRALSLVQNLKEVAEEIKHIPLDLVNNEDSKELIRKAGFKIFLKTNKSFDEIQKFIMLTPFLKECQFKQVKNENEFLEFCQNSEGEDSSTKKIPMSISEVSQKEIHIQTTNQTIISVNVTKLDLLMDLVGELVIAESMVTQNPDLKGLSLENFQKSARQLKKITGELQDMVMSIRMVPLSATFHKMNRIVRDMSKRLSKEVNLEIIGEDTEVDKNIIEHISDPLMHIIRNAIDHGLESADERKAKGKLEAGTVTLEAKNAGGDVLIIIKDDGRGLDREKILIKARENGLVNRPESELTDKEVFSCIFSPGFSTKENVTEFSGRGVGMDVVVKNIGAVGGTVAVDSQPDAGTTITLKMPLTLAIMGGMVIKVGKTSYTIPINNIKESFRAREGEVITDPEGNEMIIIRGECFPILRLHKRFKVKTEITDIPDGIMLMTESENKTLCIFADELIGEQQVVVKAMPDYIKRFKKVNGLSGCTLLGDGSISLILDATGLMNN